MIQSLDISREIYEKLVTITQRAKPNEACAYLFKDDSIVVEAIPRSKSPVSFDNIDEEWILSKIKEHGSPSSLFHSHPGRAMPSNKDYLYMIPTIAIWGSPWLIMSSDFELKAWTLDANESEREIKEITVEIKDEQDKSL